MKRSAMRNILDVLVGRLKPRPVQPGGHPTIPYGKIIAKPLHDGGYALSVYHGIVMGWVPAGRVAADEDVQAAMANLAQPVEEYTPNKELSTSDPARPGQEEE